MTDPQPIQSLDDLRLAWVLRREEHEQRRDSEWRRLWRRWSDRSELPDGPVRLYRGATRATRRGMSWTWSATQAAGYAEACGPEGRIWTALVEPEAVIGLIPHDHGLARTAAGAGPEVIVDPARLGRITPATDQQPEATREADRPRDRVADRVATNRARRDYEEDFGRSLRSRRGNGRTLLANAVAARREADTAARRGGRRRP